MVQAMSEREALKHVYGLSLYAVDNLRIVEAMLSSRGIALNEEERAFLNAAYESIADAQESIEAVVPKELL